MGKRTFKNENKTKYIDTHSSTHRHIHRHIHTHTHTEREEMHSKCEHSDMWCKWEKGRIKGEIGMPMQSNSRTAETNIINHWTRFDNLSLTN